MTEVAAAPDPPPGRVRRRREARLNEIVAAATEVMAETGAAALSLGAVARRLGIRTPSLYEHVDSRAALCDEVFRRGWGEFGRLTEGLELTADTDLASVLQSRLEAGLSWALNHRPHAELMFWRPIPGWQPSPDAFAPAVASMDAARVAFARAQQVGLVRSDVAVDEVVQTWITLTAGLISQQLANEPGVDPAHGRASRYLTSLVAMFVHHYRPQEDR